MCMLVHAEGSHTVPRRRPHWHAVRLQKDVQTRLCISNHNGFDKCPTTAQSHHTPSTHTHAADTSSRKTGDGTVLRARKGLQGHGSMVVP
eukprot:m.134195 g.134195  ORF g.134195 m.134195 type:complete len:90 (+) comp13858_c1_seq1:11055-11324(+)